MFPDWRSDDYDALGDLELGGLAWECLRRNPEYRAAVSTAGSGTPDAARWGLRFRDGCRSCGG